MISESGADVVVNCLGLLQDQPGQSTQDVHEGFVSRLIEALRDIGKPVLLIHTSIPGNPADDGTAFAVTKRSADRLIQASGLPYAVLRPGMVWAAAPYGGRRDAARPGGFARRCADKVWPRGPSASSRWRTLPKRVAAHRRQVAAGRADECRARSHASLSRTPWRAC